MNAVISKIAVCLLVAAVAGCAATEREQRAGTGALIGAGAGALAGQAIGGNTRSTVVGAGAGALLGAVVGTASAPQSSGYCRFQRADGSIYTARC
ncbi:MAG: YMGG-like glycine zipper-containing protein [Pseudomonadota bacterium]|nr:YMGG-like glycine zipper-containing protein [Pseudomonadota bacterium]